MSKKTVFDFASQVGITKHLGGLAATEELIQLIGIKPDHEVLEVGCGVGQSSVLVVKHTNCRLTGVDIYQGMLEYATNRAQQQNVSDRTDFRLGDISKLPFEKNRFDVVFGESITVFAPDIGKAISEYARVLKPGGVVGINEAVWLKENPSQELIDWFSQDIGAGGHTCTVDEWKIHMHEAGLMVETVKVYDVDLSQELRGILRRYGCLGYLVVTGRMLRLYFRDPEYRSFLKEVRQGGGVPKNLKEYFGYALFVARKPEVMNS
ncbi:MAG: methyltransferase domain-containing protein [Anaerolineales bacterium]|nr:methyltransferase domain-containing protein [Anaerolineales bacterium]